MKVALRYRIVSRPPGGATMYLTMECSWTPWRSCAQWWRTRRDALAHLAWVERIPHRKYDDDGQLAKYAGVQEGV
jgi:hypothetical protein